MLQTELLRQQPDSSWAGATKTHLEQALRSPLPERSSLRSVDCRRTLCRLEVANEDQAAFDKTARQVSTPTFWSGAGFITDKAESTHGKPLTMTVFLAREGFDLPDEETAGETR